VYGNHQLNYLLAFFVKNNCYSNNISDNSFNNFIQGNIIYIVPYTLEIKTSF